MIEIDAPNAELRQAADAAVSAAGLDGHLAIELVAEGRIRELNRDHRGKDEPTDVLSFPVDERGPAAGPRELGDVVICPEHTTDLVEATVHGVLHLLGYDHAEPDEEKEMFALQSQLLEEWVADQVEAYHQDRQSEKDRRLLDKSRYFDEP